MDQEPSGLRFDWGNFEDFTQQKTFVPFKNGRSLFVLRQNNVIFPVKRWWKPPFYHVDAVGYLNVRPIHLEAGGANLVSKDGVSCSCALDLEVEIKEDLDSKRKVIFQNDDLYNSLRLTVQEALQKVLRSYEYERIFLYDNIFIENLNAGVGNSISSSTPYLMRRLLVDSVASISEGLDDAIRKAAETQVQSEKLAFISEKNRQSQLLQQKNQLEDLIHELDMEKLRASETRKIEIDNRKEELMLQKIEAEQNLALISAENRQGLDIYKQKNDMRIEQTGALIDRIGKDAQMWFALNQPNLYAKMQIAGKEAEREMAIAMQQLMQEYARDQGAMETLKGVMRQTKWGYYDQTFNIDDDDLADEDGYEKE